VTAYEDFLESKRRIARPVGVTVEAEAINPMLHEWQRAIVAWAVNQGRAAIFADCGLGKTFMQLEWARLISDRTLILAPLTVARQTVREANKLGIDATYVRSETNGPGVWVTNYEMVDEFDPSTYGAVVLDEASILKNVEGSTRRKLTSSLAVVPYRLACSATPAPNDVAEHCNQAEFLGVMPRVEMLAAFFVHDEIGWRPKGHAIGPMYRWMSTWSVAMRKPSDAGYSDEGYDLPPLSIIAEIVDVDIDSEGQLFATELGGIGGRASVRRATLCDRCTRAAALCTRPGQWLIWCGLNDEASTIARLVDGAVNVEGSWTPDEKAAALEGFQDGTIRVLVTKCSIAGFGMNFQNCHQMAFVGLSDSYEAYYQAIRRCWRFGQQEPVDVHVIVSNLERQIVDNIKRKEIEATTMAAELVRYSPIRLGETLAAPGVHHRRVPRRMLASTVRR
jgi:superfamily II DNA or RNA helicase